MTPPPPDTNNFIGFLNQTIRAGAKLCHQLWRCLTTAARAASPRFWLKRHHQLHAQTVTANLLPHAYDPCAIELAVRSQIVAKPLHPAGEREIPKGGNIFDEVCFRLDEAARDRRYAVIGAAEIGFDASVDVAKGFAAIDHDLFTAVGRVHEQNIDTLSSLSSTLRAHSDTHWWSGRFPDDNGSLNTIHGHVGESILARHFESAGLHVDIPSAANNPGWDMAVNGHPLDVKAAVKDVWSSSISQHFAAHPEIPVVVSSDALHIPAEAIHFDHTAAGIENLAHGLDHSHASQVFVDDSLPYHQLHEHVQLGTSAAIGGPDVAHAHFPIVTLALSGVREISLLLSDKTDPVTALKNAALDVTGTGLGGAAGMKAGALIGSIFGPIGAAVGAVVGGVGGAMAARQYTNEFKMSAFRAASSEYESVANDLRSLIKTEEEHARVELNQLRATKQAELRQLARIAKRDLEVGVLRLQERADARVVISGEATICEVRTTLEKLSALRCDIEKRLRLKSIWRRWFWPNAEILGEQAALKFLTTINRQFEEMRGRLESGQAVSRSQLFTLFGIAGMSSDFVCSTLTALYAGQTEEQHRLKLTSQQRLAELAALRDRSIETLNKKWESIVSGVRDRIMPWVSELNKREDVVKIEAGKLGLA